MWMGVLRSPGVAQFSRGAGGRHRKRSTAPTVDSTPDDIQAERFPGRYRGEAVPLASTLNSSDHDASPFPGRVVVWERSTLFSLDVVIT